MAYLLDSGLAIALNNTPTTAIRASGGASGATSVVITTANANIAYDQTITGTGFAANTKVTSVSGTTVNFSPAATGNITGTITFATTWYKLTDHNRQAIEVTPQLIEKEARMANGTMRKFVVAKKDTISTSWEFLPAKSTDIVDGNYSGSWLTAFYNANVGLPIYLKLVASKHNDPATGVYPVDSSYATAQNTSKVYNVFITSFSRTVSKRTRVTDYIDMSIEFTEV
jgi:hypothetical protein